MTTQFAIVAILSIAAAGCGSTAPTGNTSNSSAAPANTTAASNNSAPSNSAAPASSPGTNTTNAAPVASPTETTDKEGNKKVNVHFAPGKSEGTYSNSFAGYSYVDYEFKASKGQKLTTKIVKSDGGDAILGVMRNDLMVAPGSTQVADWSGELPEDGTYTIRVGQMRSQARRSEKPKNFTLQIKID